MKGETVKCANPACEILFEKKKHNQKYHDDECCRDATNNRLKEQYHARKARRSGAKRKCIEPGCTTFLSKYNPENVCGAHKEARREQRRVALLRRFG